MPTIKTQDIKKGDQFRSNGKGWDALADAGKDLGVAHEWPKDDEIGVRVRYFPDGGQDCRIFKKDASINVIRESEEKVVEQVQTVDPKLADALAAVRPECDTRDATTAFTIGYKAGVLAAIEELRKLPAIAGQKEITNLAFLLTEHFKEAGKI